MRRRQWLVIGMVSIVYGVLGFYVLANIVPFNVPIFNPAQPPYEQDFLLLYPPNTGCFGKCSPYGQLSVDAVLRSGTSPIFDNQMISVTASASEFPPMNATSIKLTLDGSLAWVYAPSPGGVATPPQFGGVTMRADPTCSSPRASYGPPYLCGQESIYWPLPGSYSPTLSITLSNGTTVSEQLSDYRIPVYPADVFGTRQYNRTTIALTVAVTILAFAEGVKIVLDQLENGNKIRPQKEVK